MAITAINYPKLKKLLITHEGKRLFPYRDTRGYETIGVGRNLTSKGLNEDEVQFLLTNDIDEIVGVFLQNFPWYPDLDEVRKRALIDLTFNVGWAGLLTFKKFLEFLSIKDYNSASSELTDSLWAKQVGSRAGDVIDMIRRGIDPYFLVN